MNHLLKQTKNLPSEFSGVIVVVEVGASARIWGQIKPHPMNLHSEG